MGARVFKNFSFLSASIIAMGITIFLTEVAPPFLVKPVSISIELLVAIPSIIYGMWGLFYFAPLIQSFFVEVAQFPSLTVSIYNLANYPDSESRDLAWAASFVLTMLVLFINLMGRFLTRDKG